MKEVYELRFFGKYKKYLPLMPDSKVLGDGLVIVAKLTPEDERISIIKDMHEKLINQGEGGLFSAWEIHRKYTKEELGESCFFHMRVKSMIGFGGEEFGTVYDDGLACPECGSGGKQIGPLFVDSKKIPKNKDIFQMLSGELVVSNKIKLLFEDKKISGIKFMDVYTDNKYRAPSESWFQLIIICPIANIMTPTKVSVDLFIDDISSKCSKGDLVGLNLISELYFSIPFDDLDFFSTKNYIGVRRGILRPSQLIIISAKVRNILIENEINGIIFDVAHKVNRTRQPKALDVPTL